MSGNCNIEKAFEPTSKWVAKFNRIVDNHVEALLEFAREKCGKTNGELEELRIRALKTLRDEIDKWVKILEFTKNH